MKDFSNLRKSKWLLLMLLTMLVGVSPAWAQDELTVYDGTTTNAQIPIYGYYNDYYTKSEFVIPASELSAIKGATLTGMTFYASQTTTPNGKYQFFIKEVESTTLSAFSGTDGATTVYTGSVSISASKEMHIDFEESYQYGGGNLLIGCYTSNNGSNYPSNNFYGTTVSGASMAGYNSSSLSSISNASQQNFIPKTTFTYELPAEGPAFKVKGYKTGDSYSFGLVDAGTKATFTLTNPGTESVTVNVAATGGYAVDKSSVTIAAKGEETVTVTVADGNGTVVFTPTAAGLDPITVNLSATVKDPSKMFVDFADGKLPEGWTETGYNGGTWSNYSWAYTAATSTSVGYAGYSASSASYAGTLTSPVLEIAEGEKIFIDYARYGSYTSSYYTSVLKVETSADGESWQDAGSIANLDAVYGTWKTLEATAPAAAKYIKITGAYIYITNIYGGSLPKNPVLSFSAADYDFGFVNAATESATFTVKNAGGADMTGLSITSDNDAFSISSYSSTVAMGGQTTFTVTLGTAKIGTQTATIKVAGAGDEKTFKVGGFVLGEGVFYEDFSGNKLPDGWENTGWTFSNGTAVAGMNLLLTTPALTVAEGESMAIRLKKGTRTAAPELFYSLDGGTTQSANLVESTLSDSEYTTVFIEGVAAGNYSITLDGYNVIIDAIGGFKLNDNAPKLGIYSDEACTTAISSAAVDVDFGFVTESDDCKIYFKNIGTGTLNLSVSEAPAGFSAVLSKAALAKGEVATMTLSILEATKGYREGTVTVTAADELGSLTINTNGVMVDADKVYVDFTATDAKFPAGWTQGNWTVSSSYTDYTSQDDASTIQTTKLVAAAGEPLLIEAKNNSLGYRYAAALSYSYSRDNGATWSEEQNLTSQLTTDYQLFTLTDIADASAESSVIVRLTGKNVAIRRIYGFTQPAAAIMTTDAADYDFGMQTEAAQKVFTVKNEGASTLTGIKAVLTENTDYEVVLAKNTLDPNEETTLTVTQKFDLNKLGAHSDVLTISADDQLDVVVNLSGKTRDGSKLYIDFDNEGWPSDWTFSSAMSTTTTSGNTYAYKYGASTITTSPLTVAADEVLTLQAGYYSGSTGTLNVLYSADGGVTWSEANVSQKTFNNTAWQDVTVSGIPAGKVVLQFVCNSIKVDNISGFSVGAEMPVVALTKGGEAVVKVDGAFPAVDFGSVNETQTAVYTLANNGTAELVSTVATTGDVTAEITGSDVNINGNKVTVPVGKSATITVTMEAVAPFGAKAGQMTITSEGGVGTIAIDYKANMVDPTALFVDFEDNAWKDGWYHASSWYITYNGTPRNYYAYNSSYTKAQIITPLLTVSGESDALTYEVAKYLSSSSSPELTVEYSTDRKEWTAATVQPSDLTTDFKSFTLSGVPAGNYYLRFTGAQVKLDNIMGWHLVQGIEHDLYVTTSNIPTATKVPETSITATATVTSLIAAETGVYAKLFFDETEVATATAADIAKNGTKTFSLTGNVPAAEKTYAAKIVVYYSDGTEAFTTATTEVEVAHTRTLRITDFALTSEAEVTADADNKFTATFNVTVKNTGTTDLEADKVSVSVIDAEGNAYETTTATAVLAKDDEVVLPVSVTTSALEGGVFTFKAKENLSNTTYATAQTVTVSAAAPKFELAEKDGAAVNDGDAVSFGLVRAATTKTYTITNSGLKALELVSIVAPEGYEATALTEANKTIAVGGTLDIDVTLKALQGKKSGDLVFTYKVDASTQKTFTLKLDGQSIAADTWVETFDTEISADWTGNISSSDWMWNSSYQAAYAGSYNYSKELISPRLAANAGDELTFDVNFTYSGYNLKAEYSTDKATWTEIGTYEYADRGTKVFTAPATGNYYLKFTATRYALLDNLIGFRLDKPEHDTEIASSSVPTTGTQYADYTATVRLKENLNKAEEVTAKLYVDGKAVAETTETIAAKSTTTVTVTWEPQEVIETAVKAYVEVTYAGGTLTTDAVDLTIAAPYTLDEEDGTVASGTYPALLLKRTFNAGWNTVCLPFAVAAEDVTTLFGEGAKVYSFTSYTSDGELQFNSTTSLSSGMPYIVYVKEAITETIVVKNASIASYDDTPGYQYRSGATFQGTYAPVAAPGMEGKWGVTTAGKIQKGTDKASIKGFRAYFDLPAGASGARLSFTDETTGVTRVIAADELDAEDLYNLQGQKVDRTHKGLYIQGGKKVIVK